ncbi:MAG: GNAT family N-acetyltransferase [Proteobacteria bacterium]|nr:GNAT family N-acetyltransferase [Pseudomonadota bacterium]
MRQISEALQSAVRFQQSGQFHEAEAICLKICATLPDHPDTLHLLAIIYAQTQRFQLANDYFQKAIAKTPTRADFLGNYANALLEQNLIEDAIAYCARSLALKANQAEVLNVLGSAYMAQNRHQKAAECFRQTLQIRPQFPHALNNLGNALQKTNNSAEAVSCYQRALELTDDYFEAHNNLGLALKTLGKIDEARAHFRKALQLNPSFIQASHNLAEVDSNWLEPLEGKKLYLRRYQEQDAAYLRDCHRNDVFMSQYNQYIPRNQALTELAAKLREVHAMHPCQTKSVDWMIVRKNTRQPAGIANLVDINLPHRRAELLIGLPDPEDHTRGIALEATLLILDYAFNRVKLNKLTSNVYADNSISQKNTVAVGFTQESYLREHIFDPIHGKFLDIYGNGMTAHDFRSNKRISKLSVHMLDRDITAA